MSELLVGAFVLFWAAFLSGGIASILAISFQYGHRFSSFKEALARRVFKRLKKIEWFEENIKASQELHQSDAIDAMNEVYGYGTSHDKLLGLISCQYCLSVVVGGFMSMVAGGMMVLYGAGAVCVAVVVVSIPVYSYLAVLLIDKIK